MTRRSSSVISRPPLWRCSRCGRRFANRNQSHACARHTLKAHFAGKPAAIRTLYNELAAAIRAIGPVIVLPEKTRIAFQVRMSFAVAMPRREWLDGHLVLARRLEHPRFRRVETFSPRNHLHAFRLERPDEIDAEFKRWLSEAYAVGAQEHLRVKSPASPVEGGRSVARIVDSLCVLAVRDLTISTRYYIDMLGFANEPIDAPGWSFLTRDTFRVMLGECPDEQPASDIGNHSYVAYWNVDDVDELHRELATRGASITSTPSDKPWGLREFGLRTPDGHRITCGQVIRRS